jgi:hypothetical protein
MLQLRNGTGLAATIFISPDPDGVDTVYTVVKGTFALGETLVPAAEQLPIALAPVHYGEPAETSMRVPSDMSLVKPGTDVLLLGHAYAPGDRPATQVDVSLSAGALQRTVRVFGDRVWRNGIAPSISAPEPFQRMPLVWERAYGGTEAVGGEVRGEARNPVGTGFRARDSERPVAGIRLPNLEDPARLIGSWKDTPAPACFAPVSAHWEPRQSYAGTYDAAWQATRAPYVPADFDPRFFQLAPPGLVAPDYLRGGEAVEVRGATPNGLLRFRIPEVRVTVTYTLDSGSQPRPAPLDTVLIEPDAGRVVLVWRSALACDKKALRVREVAPAVARAA